VAGVLLIGYVFLDPKRYNSIFKSALLARETLVLKKEIA